MGKVYPKYSILIPAYKAEFFAEALRSVKEQTCDDFQCVVVDDSSPEDLKSIFGDVAGDDSRFEYYRNESNYGAVDVVDNWNKCLSCAKGEYVICMGDDDRLLPNCLEAYAKLMEIYPSLDAYHAQTEIMDENSEVYEIQAPRPVYESVYSLLCNRWMNRWRQYIGDFCFKAEKLREMGGYYKLPLAWASDDITAVMMAKDTGIANTQIPCFQYRASSLTITNASNACLKLEAIVKEKEWYESFLENEPINELDRIYRKMALGFFYSFFRTKQDSSLWEALNGKPCRIKQCIQNRKKYELSLRHIILVMCRVLKYRMMQLFRRKQ